MNCNYMVMSKVISWLPNQAEVQIVINYAMHLCLNYRHKIKIAICVSFLFGWLPVHSIWRTMSTWLPARGFLKNQFKKDVWIFYLSLACPWRLRETIMWKVRRWRESNLHVNKIFKISCVHAELPYETVSVFSLFQRDTEDEVLNLFLIHETVSSM